jgi:hypothetical protein
MVEALEPFAMYEAGSAEAKAKALAEAYALGYVMRQEPGPDRAVGGTTSAAAAAIGVAAITAEAGGCGLVEEGMVALHVRGLGRVLTEMGMADADANGAPLARRAWGRRHLGRFPVAALRPGGLVEPWWRARSLPKASFGQVHSIDGGRALRRSVSRGRVMIFLTSSPAVAADGLLLGAPASRGACAGQRA